MNQILILLPEVFLSIATTLILMFGIFFKCGNIKFTKSIFAIVYAIALYLLFNRVSGEETYIFDNLFKMDLTIKILKLMLLTAATFFMLLVGDKSINNKNASTDQNYEFPVIITFSIIGMLCMLSANNFLSLYVSIELQSLCLYVLAAYEKDNSRSSEAGVKYFVLGSFSSGLMLFGMSLIYGFTGNVDFNSLKILLSSNGSNNIAIGTIIGIIMVMIGLFFKSSAAPFHMWTPDVYQGSPTIVTTLFASLPKLAALGVLTNLSINIFSSWKNEFQPILLFITAASVLIGAIGALRQNDIKRILAYSSIGHVGYILLSITAFDKESFQSVIGYLEIYISMTLASFAIIMNLAKNGKNVTDIQDLAGLSQKRPLLAIALSILMFSLAGIPPFAGFFAKFYVFKVAIASGLYVLSVISIIAAVIAAYYYLRLVKMMFLDTTDEDFTFTGDLWTKFVIVVLVLYNLAYIIL